MVLVTTPGWYNNAGVYHFVFVLASELSAQRSDGGGALLCAAVSSNSGRVEEGGPLQAATVGDFVTVVPNVTRE